jgi:MoaA/NifB/PqqE/SkfB family radical SAM enzyme
VNGRSKEYFTILPHAQFVHGARGVAVHDLFRSRIIWFREKSVATALARMAKGDRQEDAAHCAGISREILKKHLSVLIELGLGIHVGQPTASETFRSILTRGQAREVGVFQPNGKVTVELANECVYCCPWCVPANSLTTRACVCGVWPAQGKRLSLKDRIFAIERLNEQGKSRLVIQGGEPLLLWDEMLEMVKSASRLGMSCEIHSTGILLDRSRVELLRGHKVSFALLLAPPPEFDFNAAVGRHDAWDKLHNAIELLRQSGVPFSAKVPLSVSATERADQLGEWAFALGAGSVEYIFYAPPVDGYTVDALCATSKPSSPQAMAVGATEFIQNAQCHSCFANACFIASDGLVSPCMGMREPLADLQEIPMTQVLREDRLGPPQESTARWRMAECALCEFRFGCWSCLVRTTEFRGSSQARHWDCPYEPQTGTWNDNQS